MLQKASEMVNRGYRLAAPEYTPIIIQELMNRCWQLVSWKRPPFLKITKSFIQPTKHRPVHLSEELKGYLHFTSDKGTDYAVTTEASKPSESLPSIEKLIAYEFVNKNDYDGLKNF